jgi:predicted ester cyclase
MTTIHPLLAVLRRYVVDYLQSGNPTICAQIMEPDYVLHMGGTDLGPRDSVYVPAVLTQLQQFPGLGMTVNEIVFDGERVAMRFTQHGSSVRHDGRLAAWSGIGIYRWNGTRLTSNYAIEDYAGRREQLATGRPAVVASPALSPWTTPPQSGDPEAEHLVRAWLAGGSWAQHDRVTFDDATAAPDLIDVEHSVVDELVGAGRAIAFHTTQTGRYRGGLSGPGADAIGRPCTLFSVGIVHVRDDGLLDGHVIRERGALERSLR